MPRKVPPLPSSAEIDKEKDAALKLAGEQVTLVSAWASPDSAFLFHIPDIVVEYFKIDVSGEGISESIKIYVPKSKIQANSSGVQRVKPSPIVGVRQRILVPKGKLIKLPVTKDKPATKKIKSAYNQEYARKFFGIRVPTAMSLNALSLWINTQFGQNKPLYVMTVSGKRWDVLENFKDKSKLAKIGRQDVEIAK